MRDSRLDEGPLLARLRDEAVRDRPAFDPDMHRRLLRAVRRRGEQDTASGARGAETRRLIVLAACLGLACGGIIWRGDRDSAAGGHGRPPGPTTAGVTPVPGIDSLPSVDEFGEVIAGSIGSLAATVVGLPEWRALAVAGLPGLEAWRIDAGDGGWPADERDPHARVHRTPAALPGEHEQRGEPPRIEAD